MVDRPKKAKAIIVTSFVNTFENSPVLRVLSKKIEIKKDTKVKLDCL
jgi:hypothetical protein